MWTNKTINLGEVKVGANVAFTFHYGGTKDVLIITPSCSCTDVEYERPLLQGTLVLKTFPTNSLINGDERVTVTKQIDVLFTDNSKDTLTVSAQLLNPNFH